MKRKLLAAILGIAGSVACSYGQGTFLFSTYYVGGASAYGPVIWASGAGQAPAGMAGLPVAGGSSVTGSLTYSYNNGGTQTVNTGPVASLVTLAGQDGYLDDPSPINLPAAANPGGYPNGSGAGPAITMTINLGGTFNGSLVTGTLSWVEAAGFTQAPAQQFLSYPGGLTLAIVPEPSTMALLGLGSAALLIFRKRK
jgi:hypothetical protein